MIARAICASYIGHTLGIGLFFGFAPAINKLVLPTSQGFMLLKISLVFDLNIDLNILKQLANTVITLGIGMGAESILENLIKNSGMQDLTINISVLSNAFTEIAQNMGYTMFIDNIGTILNQAFPHLIEQMYGGIPLIGGVSAAVSTLFLGLAYIDVLYEVSEQNLNSNQQPSLTMCEDLLKEKYEQYLNLIKEFLKNINNFGDFGGVA